MCINRTAQILVAPERIPQLEAGFCVTLQLSGTLMGDNWQALYSVEIAEAYQAAPGFSSAHLFVKRDTGEVQSVTVWESPGVHPCGVEGIAATEFQLNLGALCRASTGCSPASCV